MPTIAIVDGVAILMYIRDHAPPHFHAKFAEHECKMAILDGAVLEGNLPSNKVRRVREWLKMNRDEVISAWTLLQAGRTFKGKIG
jgi:hypothetical protein